jgi:DNA-binding NtrC family response regulator
MRDSTILTITKDDEFLSVLRGQLHEQVGGGTRMVLSRSIDDACSLLKSAHPRVVVVHWTGDNGRYEQLDRLLWSTSVQARRAPVVVIAERYRIDQATMMYRMGVSEYISRTHHLDQLVSVLSVYLPPTVQVRDKASAGEPAQSGNAWLSNHKPEHVASQAV